MSAAEHGSEASEPFHKRAHVAIFPLLGLLALASLVGCGARPCRAGTVFVDLLLPGALAEADHFDIAATVGGTTRTRLATRSDSGDASFELDFAGAYPAGETLSLTVVAMRGSQRLGAGSDQLTLPSGCGSLPLALRADPAIDTDAGTADLSTKYGDASTDAASTDQALGNGCAGFGGITCLDFEDLAPYPSWSLTITGGTGARDNSRAHRGSASYRFNVPIAKSTVSADLTYNLSPVPDTLWARAFVYMTTTPPGKAELVNFYNGGMGAGVSVFVLADGTLSLDSTSSVGAPVAGPALNTWVCLELGIAAGSAMLFRDEFQVAMLDVSTIGLLSNLFMGPELSAPSKAWSVWYDDVGVDSERIGCTR